MKSDFERHIPLIEEKIKYEFKDKSLLAQAFTRTSFCNEQSKSDKVRFSSNEVLEFFGDGVLSLAIITVLMSKNTERYEYGIKTSLGEGDFSNIKSKLSDKKNLSKSMSELGLQEFLRVGEGDEKLGIKNEPSVMEDLFESIIGAVYIDCGMNIPTVLHTVSAMLDTGTYLSKNTAVLQSAKNAIQEWCADKKRRLPPPVYKTISEEGPDHKKTYTRACEINGVVMGVGIGKNCKIADAAAAEAALEKLKAQESESKEVSAPMRDGASKLRSFCAKNKLGAPIFTDLGEQEGSDDYAKMYEFECVVKDVKITKSARSKSEARSAAAEEMLKLLEAK